MSSTQPIDTHRLMRHASYASVTTALILIFVKLIAWLITDSVSILATLIDSSLDILASLLNMFAIRHALIPADHEHRFGHGKAEALAGMGQAMFIVGSAGVLLLQAAGRLLHPQPAMTGFGIGVGVMIFSIVATLLLLSYQRYVIKHTNSTAIKADALHYKSDLLVNGSVILALVLTFYGWSGFDSIFAIGIALFILYSAWQIVSESINLLMDKELPDDERDKIYIIVSRHPSAKGMHDLRTRRAGTTVFIQLHLEIDGNLKLAEAHEIADEVELEIKKIFPDSEVIIHEDPVATTV